VIIKINTFPRAALVGNPSDGYHGKTIAFTFTNFHAEVLLYQTPELEILPSKRDHSIFSSIRDLVSDVNLYGYYGGIRLLKAAVKKFFDYSTERSIEIDNRNFTIRYSSTIPNRLGLAGSSAIITGAFKAMMAFYSIDIPKPILANLILSVETEELGIPAGLQDRVAQVYQSLVYMDFSKPYFDKYGYGKYEYLDPNKLKNVYIAYRADLSEGTEVLHSNLREKYLQGNQEVYNAIDRWAEITDIVREELEKNDAKIGDYLNENYNLRKKVCTVSEMNHTMVMTARSIGATAKFTGSGGAIIGTYEDETQFKKLQHEMKKRNVEVIKPTISSRE
jgi:glucuronokinase